MPTKEEAEIFEKQSLENGCPLPVSPASRARDILQAEALFWNQRVLITTSYVFQKVRRSILQLDKPFLTEQAIFQPCFSVGNPTCSIQVPDFYASCDFKEGLDAQF